MCVCACRDRGPGEGGGGGVRGSEKLSLICISSSSLGDFSRVHVRSCPPEVFLRPQSLILSGADSGHASCPTAPRGRQCCCMS